MKYTNRFSAKRLGYTVGMTMVFIIANTLLCITSSVLVDKYINSFLNSNLNSKKGCLHITRIKVN